MVRKGYSKMILSKIRKKKHAHLKVFKPFLIVSKYRKGDKECLINYLN